MKVLSQSSDSLVGAYVCPDGFVSQVVYFSTNADREWFHNMLREQVGDEAVNERDIRVATRHGWELGEGAEHAFKSSFGGGGVMQETYWTRYPQTDEQKQQAVSLCVGDGTKAGCMRLFVHNRNTMERLCPSCKVKSRN